MKIFIFTLTFFRIVQNVKDSYRGSCFVYKEIVIQSVSQLVVKKKEWRERESKKQNLLSKKKQGGTRAVQDEYCPQNDYTLRNCSFIS